MKIPLTIDSYYKPDSFVIEYVINHFQNKFKTCLLNEKSIFISHNTDYPIAFSKRVNPLLEYDYIILITNENSYYSQLIYQLAHEMSHVVMDCCPDEPKFKWISECLCEAASCYMLLNGVEFFRGLNNHDYADKMEDYLINHTSRSLRRYGSSPSFVVKAHLEYLEKHQTENDTPGRPLLSFIGDHIFFDIIQHNENGWSAITLIPHIDATEDDTIHTFHEKWSTICETSEQENFVCDVYKLFIC
jgi:hypothetical protein